MHSDQIHNHYSMKQFGIPQNILLFIKGCYEKHMGTLFLIFMCNLNSVALTIRVYYRVIIQNVRIIKWLLYFTNFPWCSCWQCHILILSSVLIIWVRVFNKCIFMLIRFSSFGKKILTYLKEKRKSNFIWLITENEYPFMNIFFD